MTATLGRAGWRISSYSSNGESCVDVDFTASGVEIRHSQHPHGPRIEFTADEWTAWLDEVGGGVVTNDNGAVTVRTYDGGWLVTAMRTSHELRYTIAEIDAFRRGVLDGEFSRENALAATP
ncbi:DUF397 domain-containing protein [Umezawaea sp. Da 62-37]|uniref:DUF397 domain-containing protein n=1 Tax=Umezawaea sp. Da 62-37 TaxID=3075927 RepID=UPI0028F6D2C0|nr:DUF397 domain-containing protein [Umezawaea sp. Da 62-37]WNV83065.1 DUF397 domain-containing protein [Umezawaea sp. Da 62-37]